MTTYPQVSDPMSAGTLVDGSTISHRVEHGRTIEIWENVKHHGATGDGVTDDTAAITAAITAAGTGGRVFFPKPSVSYYLASGSSITPLNGQRLIGPVPTPGGVGATISCANAYAILSTASAQVGITIENLYLTMRAGSTSGGAVKMVGSGYFSQCMLRGLLCAGQTTSTDPVIHVVGWIGSWMDMVQVSGCGGHAIKIEAIGAGSTASNASSITRSRVASAGGGAGGSTTAALYLSGTKNQRVIDNTFESNGGYGIWAGDSISPLIEGNWFEDNTNHDLYLNNGYATTVVGNIFNANHAGSADHINVTCAAANIRPHHAIISNHMNDHASSGVDIRLGTNVTHCTVMSNRNASVFNGFIVDSGGANHITANDNTTSTPDDDYYPGNIRHRFGTVNNTHNWTDIRGDGAGDSVFGHFVGASSTTFPRVWMNPNLTVDGVGSYTGLVLGKRSDSTNPHLHGGAFFGGTDVAGITVGDGATGQKTAAYATPDTFATTANASKLGFRGSTPITKATVSGSRGSNAALASLLTKLADLGLITDGTSA